MFTCTILNAVPILHSHGNIRTSQALTKSRSFASRARCMTLTTLVSTSVISGLTNTVSSIIYGVRVTCSTNFSDCKKSSVTNTLLLNARIYSINTSFAFTIDDVLTTWRTKTLQSSRIPNRSFRTLNRLHTFIAYRINHPSSPANTMSHTVRSCPTRTRINTRISDFPIPIVANKKWKIYTNESKFWQCNTGKSQ